MIELGISKSENHYVMMVPQRMRRLNPNSLECVLRALASTQQVSNLFYAELLNMFGVKRLFEQVVAFAESNSLSFEPYDFIAPRMDREYYEFKDDRMKRYSRARNYGKLEGRVTTNSIDSLIVFAKKFFWKHALVLFSPFKAAPSHNIIVEAMEMSEWWDVDEFQWGMSYTDHPRETSVILPLTVKIEEIIGTIQDESGRLGEELKVHRFLD